MPRTRAWTAKPFLVHLSVVGATSGAFALAVFDAEEPNIGAGALALPLLVLGFPWYRLLSDLDGDAALVLGSAANVVLHLALAVLRARRQTSRASNGGTRAAWSGALMMIALIGAGAVLLTAARSARVDDELRAPLTTLVPATTWDAGAVELESPCAFCDPQSLSATATRVRRGDVDEPVLLHAVDGQLQQHGYSPDAAWSCDNTSGALQDPDSERRLCARGYTGSSLNGFARIYFYDDHDPRLLLEVFRH